MKSLVIIPARGGSKGILHKNIKPLSGKPLIYYTIDVARSICSDNDICVSSDDSQIIKVVEDYGLRVPFIRPAELATDKAGMYEVLLHALKFYEEHGKHYDNIVLLQNTSPFRNAEHLREAMNLYTQKIDMIVSVVKTSSNPYYNCFEEDDNGFLHISKGNGMITRRQDAPITYEYNGAIYIINPESLKREPLALFKKRIKYVMDDISSVDLDTMLDWHYAEFLIKEKLVEL
ncbi:acylneuraminate cytidylyltransferase family protein [Prevotella brunnea]|uniref:Acylneuraminate cytidylyltransferase family protein n=1 Tax=Prevotella brunnea TaxID=2508867 RepID=A0A5C8GJ56_9BACT|nr:acylneuraminate cytidylyltransferase family protein [Prevotella brunnea]MDR0185533.1 acylneuraminate cytidylyltransferase family protein [Prevotella brunnea]TXJ62035.1 acylneuraminate cytidylyltransferase family protein [Prevotella brunnea]